MKVFVLCSRSYGNSDPFYNLSLLFNRPSSFRAIGQDDIVRGIAAEPALDNSKYKFSQGECVDDLTALTYLHGKIAYNMVKSFTINYSMITTIRSR